MKKENPIKNLVKKIEEKRIIDNNEINNYVEKSNLIKTKSDQIIFLKEYTKIFPYPGLYVGKEFLKCATLTKKYADFLVWLVKNDFYILDRSELVEAYKNNPELVEYLYNELSKNTDESVAYVLGSLLGGMGIKEPQKLFDLLLKNNDLVKPEPVIISAIQETSYFHKIPKKFIDILLRYSNSEDRSIKNNAIRVLLNRFNKNKKVCRKLTSLAKTDDDTKSMIAQLTGGISKENPALCLQLLQQCAKTNEQQIVLGIAMYVGYISRNYPIECLAILKNWLKKFDLVMPSQHMMWSAEEIGNSNSFEKLEEFLLMWIKTERDYRVLRSSLPNLIHEIYKGNGSNLLLLLKKIDFKQNRKAMLITKILEVFLSEGERDNQIRESSFLKACTKILLKIADRQNIDTIVDERIYDPYQQVLALIENINIHKKKINPLIAKRNLKQYPNIIAFFGEDKLHKLIDDYPNHSLVIFLQRAKVTKNVIEKYEKTIQKQTDQLRQAQIFDFFKSRFHPESLLLDLDHSLKMIGNERSKKIREMLLQPYQFDSAWIQVNMYARFKKKDHFVELDTKVENTDLDILLIMNKKKYFFELYTPEENRELRYIRTARSIDTAHSKEKILRKLKKQIIAADSLNEPVILVMDNHNMSVGEYDITNALFGTEQWTILFDKKTGKEVKSYTTRADDSIGRRLEYGKVISAIMIVRRYVDQQDLRVKLYGKTILNPYAKIQLDEKSIKEIEMMLFGTTIP